MAGGFTLAALLLAALAAAGFATFWVFTPLLALTFSLFGMIASNFNALAMQPVGRIAGSASALYGAVTATGGAVLGALIARSFDGTPLPFTIGLALAGAATLASIFWTERGEIVASWRRQ
jgi:DHA1 family bicyclomycin/chloramphenicol resistance-like MFS transporter